MSRKNINGLLISIALIALILILDMFMYYCLPPVNGGSNSEAVSLEYWTDGSPNAQSVIDFVSAVTDKTSARYVPPEKRIAVFDVDGTLLGELFPTYFDQCLMMHRLLHDDTYEANAEDKEYVQALEYALIHHEEVRTDNSREL